MSAATVTDVRLPVRAAVLADGAGPVAGLDAHALFSLREDLSCRVLLDAVVLLRGQEHGTKLTARARHGVADAFEGVLKREATWRSRRLNLGLPPPPRPGDELYLAAQFARALMPAARKGGDPDGD